MKSDENQSEPKELSKQLYFHSQDRNQLYYAKEVPWQASITGPIDRTGERERGGGGGEPYGSLKKRRKKRSCLLKKKKKKKKRILHDVLLPLQNSRKRSHFVSDVINKAGIKFNPSTGLHLSTAITGTATAIIDYAIGLEKLSANGEGFLVVVMVVVLKWQ